jgi:hypothetical protein
VQSVDSIYLASISILWKQWELHYAIFEVFTAVKIQVEVFWVVTPRSVAVGYPTAILQLPLCSYLDLSW